VLWGDGKVGLAKVRRSKKRVAGQRVDLGCAKGKDTDVEVDARLRPRSIPDVAWDRHQLPSRAATHVKKIRLGDDVASGERQVSPLYECQNA
jgi:hypothetical protein